MLIAEGTEITENPNSVPGVVKILYEREAA
jgi:hypothetical protein